MPEFLRSIPEMDIRRFLPDRFEPNVKRRLKFSSRKSWDDYALEHRILEAAVGRCESHIMCRDPNGKLFWVDADNL